jgi:hypothetical protein
MSDLIQKTAYIIYCIDNMRENYKLINEINILYNEIKNDIYLMKIIGIFMIEIYFTAKKCYNNAKNYLLANLNKDFINKEIEKLGITEKVMKTKDLISKYPIEIISIINQKPEYTKQKLLLILKNQILQCFEFEIINKFTFFKIKLHDLILKINYFEF